MTALYQLSKELSEINDQLITDQGEISPELELRLDQVNLALTEKATGLRKWLARIDGDTLGLDAEIERLQKIRKQHANLYERLKAYVKKNMEVADLKKIETPIGNFTIAKNPPSVELNLKPTVKSIEETLNADWETQTNVWDTPEKLALNATPEQFRVIVPETWTPDKKAIKAAIEEGYDVPGWKLVNDKTNLRIK
jgi:hypothetical protein